VAEPRAVLPEGRRDPRADDHAAEREVAAGHALGEREHVGAHVPALDAEPGPQTPEPGDDRVADEDHAGALAQRGDALDVAGGRLAHPARADDGLDEDRGDAIGADTLDLGLERLQGVVGHHGGVGVQGADVLAVGRDAADRRAHAMGAVVALRARDEVGALGRPDRGEVAARQLGRRIDGVAAARAEEDARVVERRQVGQALGEIEGGAIGEDAERLVGGELAHLRHGGVDDLGAAVTDVHAPQARGAVEVLLAVLVPHVGAIAAGDDELVAAYGVHVGEGVPEAGVGGHASTLALRLRNRQSPARRI
jgi:hypothetical protein